MTRISQGGACVLACRERNECHGSLKAMRVTFIAAAAAAMLGLAGVAAAQNPSADDIIKSLKPTGNILGGTRGIRPAKPAAPAPAAPAKKAAAAVSAVPRAAAPAPAATAENPSVSLTVQFATGSAELTPAAMRTLDELGRALSSASLAGYRFRIEGHTDTVGSRALNQALSERRAQSVVAYLESKFNVSADRLQAVGLGEAGLAVPTGPQVAEPRNRRVQVVNVGA